MSEREHGPDFYRQQAKLLREIVDKADRPRLRAPRRQHGESSKKETARKTLFAERV
jgi:hypothetical protein